MTFLPTKKAAVASGGTCDRPTKFYSNVPPASTQHARAAGDVDDDHRGGVLELAAALEALTWALVSAVLTCHPAGIPLAQSEGFQASMILSDDLRAMYVASATLSDQTLTMVLLVVRKHLMESGRWSGCGDEALVDLAMSGQLEDVRRCARAIVALHQAWERAADEADVLFEPPPPLGKLNAIKIGLAIARLARWTDLPIGLLWHEFSRIVIAQDVRALIREGEGSAE